jgi:hypothetical protein
MATACMAYAYMYMYEVMATAAGISSTEKRWVKFSEVCSQGRV